MRQLLSKVRSASREAVFILCLSLLIPSHSRAQTPDWTVILNYPPGYDLYLNDLWSLQISNNEREDYQVYLLGTVQEETRGLMFGGRSSVLTVPAGGRTVTPRDIDDVMDEDFNPEFEQVIRRLGRFPAGNYAVCVEVIGLDSSEILGRDCYNFLATLPSAPRLISPPDVSTVIFDSPLFQWTAPVPVPAGDQISCSIKICQVYRGQTPSDAIENLAHYEESEILTESLQYPVRALDFEQGNRYVWQVRAVDSNGYPVGENEGRSEIWEFTFNPQTYEVQELVVYPSKVVTTTEDQIFGHRNDSQEPLSLREAITWANDSSGPDTIAFKIPQSDQGYDSQSGVWVIDLTSQLPGLNDNETIIDGSLGNDIPGISGLPDLGQCSRPAIEIDGQGINRGIYISGDRNVIKGLAIYNFNEAGVRIEGNGNRLICNYIGTDSRQESDHGNRAGVSVRAGAKNNKIGAPDLGNLISGNQNNGILLMNGVTNTSVEGNYVGVKTDGLTRLSNGTGISIENGSKYNAIGGAGSRTGNNCDKGCNVISGNREYGVRISESDLNTVVGSFIGLGADGSTAVGNGLDGILLIGSHGNRIGGGRDNLRNVISGNRDGIVLKRSTNRKSVINKIEGNFIGTNADGNQTIPNLHRGIFLTTASEANIIGGDNDGYGNVISGNYGAGIRLDTNAKYNLIRNNWVGTNKSGDQIGNRQGIALYWDAQENVIGGGPDWGNEIAYNNGDGVHVEGADCKKNGITLNSIHHNAGKGISLLLGAHGQHPWLRIWEINPLGGGEYYIVGQLDTVYAANKIEIYSDYLDEGQYLESGWITPGEVRVGWFGQKVKLRGNQFTFLVSDSLGLNTSEFLVPPSNPAHVGQWPFDMDYWEIDRDNYLPLNPHFHGGWGNFVPLKYTSHVWGVSKLFNDSSVRDVQGFAHRIFFTTGTFCGPFINYQMPVMFTGELYFESYVNSFFDMDSNIGLKTPPGTGVAIHTQRYFNPDPDVDVHERLECPEESNCDGNDWPDDKYAYIKSYLDSTGYVPILTLEIDREETFEDWNSHPYWQNFDGIAGPDSPGFEAVGVLGKYYYQQLVDGKKAIVLGIWVHDGAHAARTEVHPVFGLAIQETAPAPNQPGKEVWHFFIRNKGNQSFCGSHVQCTGHPAWAFRIKGRPGPCTIRGLNGYAHEEDEDTVYWSIVRSGNDVVINTFIPDEDDWLIGTVEIVWP